MPLIRYPGRFSFKKLSDFKPFLDDPVRLSNIKYKLSSFEADLKTRKYGINPLFDCFHASYLPILMEIRTEVLIPKIA